MNEHETKYCPNVQVSCPAALLGCTVVVLRGQIKAHTEECRYEQSRWLVEQLDSKYDALLDKYNTLEEQHNTEITELRQLFEMKRDN
jgi:UDP-glucose 6-dehydrogenase